MENKINSVLLPWQNQLYLLPIAALVEILPTFSSLPLKQQKSAPSFLLGKICWQAITLPLVGMSLKSVKMAQLSRPRVAIVNALFASNSYSPYFAVVFEQAPIRIAIKENEMQWQEESRRSIKKLQHFTAKKEVIILDLLGLSDKIERECLANWGKFNS